MAPFQFSAFRFQFSASSFPLHFLTARKNRIVFVAGVTSKVWKTSSSVVWR